MGKEHGARKVKEPAEDELVNLIFSWSLQDAMNQHLFKDKVKMIPDRFLGLKDYLDSFRVPLLEEIRAEMSSALDDGANAARICSLVPSCSLFYVVTIAGNRGACSPSVGDIVMLSGPTPFDLASSGSNSYCFARVIHVFDRSSFKIRASKRIEDASCYSFAVRLLAFIPYARIWRCLDYEATVKRNLAIIKVVAGDGESLQGTSLLGPGPPRQETDALLTSRLCTFGLNDSQAGAILDCVSAVQCSNSSNNFSLIWGPPGTGKTKTISVLLLLLLTTSQSRCRRVLTCAPTNTAICQVASRLLALRRQYSGAGGGCHGDLLLIGNRQRMSIDGDLDEIFLDTRVKRLRRCFSRETGWKHCLGALQFFLQKNGRQFEQSFVRSRFHDIFHELGSCFRTIMSHVPRDCILEKNYNHIASLHQMLQDLSDLIGKSARNSAADDHSDETVRALRQNIIGMTGTLMRDLKLPVTSNGSIIREFCLESASLVFCTVSGSAKLNGKQMDLLLIDEAAQLKECESLIPLQSYGLKHVVLIGDECQLPAMVKSKISEKALLGRSLFERLSLLGYKKHLLNTQYRMHPSISIFPNITFYDKEILDGPNVKQSGHQRGYLEGAMFGSYSFINIQGREDPVPGRSKRNMAEVAAIMEILHRLKEGSGHSSQDTRCESDASPGSAHKFCRWVSR